MGVAEWKPRALTATRQTLRWGRNTSKGWEGDGKELPNSIDGNKNKAGSQATGLFFSNNIYMLSDDYSVMDEIMSI